MATIDLSSLVQQVEMLIDDSSAVPMATGDDTLDAALADYRTARTAGQQADSPELSFWS
jgi:hypothetical protein